MRLCFALVCLVGWACNTTVEEAAPPSLTLAELPLVDSAYMDEIIAELAADRYLGRLPFGPGEPLTLDYLEEQFRSMGIPVQRQEVPMVEITGASAPTIQMSGPGGNIDWAVGEDYMITTDQAEERILIEEAPLVFCGYGIVAPEYGHDDYAGLDMRGKIAVVLVNDPGYQTENPDSFRGNTMTYYGRWTYKYEEAARQGAEGVLIVHETGAAGYGWDVVRNSWSGTRLTLDDPNVLKAPLNGWISLASAQELFTASGIQPPKPWFQWALEEDFKPVDLNMTLSTSIQNELRTDKSYNLIARIEGLTNADEYVLYTSHWDHIGTGPAVNGDTIYNGALDNASGTAQMLAIAKAFSELEEPPARSIVFASVTAEEQGLFGSEYYAKNPLYSLEDCVGTINMDGINYIGLANDLTITGKGHSSMDELAEQLAEEQGRYVQAEQEPEKGYFYRSDHFNLAKAGVPALYAAGGYDHREYGKVYAKEQSDDYLMNRYHRPADEYVSGQWPLSGAVQDGQLFLGLGLYLAKSDHWPQWYETSEFRGEGERGSVD